MTAITTERLVLRELADDDAAFIVELMNDPDWLRFIGDRGMRTLDDARGYIATGPREMYARHGYGLYAVERRNEPGPIGICGLVRRDWLEDADLGFAFLPRFRGAGYAHEAAAATLEHAAALGLHRILAIVSPENEASVRLLAKIGMTFQRMASPAPDAAEVCVYGRELA
ncbi:MAG: GNAT family N-acetyltransferase [Longimicrobiaceae bacterium]